jgi:hypothetical protein
MGYLKKKINGRLKKIQNLLGISTNNNLGRNYLAAPHQQSFRAAALTGCPLRAHVATKKPNK